MGLCSNGNDIEAKRNEASILRHFLHRSETNKLILKLKRSEQNLVHSLQDRRENELGQSKTLQKRNVTNWVSPKLYRNKTKQTGVAVYSYI